MVFDDLEPFRGGYPDVVEKISALIVQPDYLADLNERLAGLAEVYAEDKSIMRFQLYRPDKMLAQVRRFAKEAVPYQARESVADAFGGAGYGGEAGGGYGATRELLKYPRCKRKMPGHREFPTRHLSFLDDCYIFLRSISGEPFLHRADLYNNPAAICLLCTGRIANRSL